MLTILFILWISAIHKSSADFDVDMSLAASFQFNLTEFQPCENCKAFGSIYVIYLKICSIQIVKSLAFLEDYKTRFHNIVSDDSNKTCVPYENNEVFLALDKDENLECSPVVIEVTNNSDAKSYKFNRVTNMDIEKWDGKIIIMSIVGIMENNCVNSTIMSYFQLEEIFTHGKKSDFIPKEIMVQNGTADNKLLAEESDMLKASDVGTKLNLSLWANCPENLFQKGCWYSCARSERNECDMNEGYQICFSGWTKDKVTYCDKKRKSFGHNRCQDMWECNLFDICKLANCTERCVATSNSTYVCTDYSMKFDPTGDILLPGDTVLCYVDFDKKEDPKYIWEYLTPDVNARRTLSNIIVSGNKMIVMPRATPSYGNMMYCYSKNDSGTITYNVSRNYTIIKHPSTISLNVTMQHIYLGDSLECYSNAWPINVYKYFFDVVSRNFIPPMYQRIDNVIKVPMTATLGEMILNCSIDYSKDNTSKSTFYRVFRLYIYAFRQFKWIYDIKSFYYNNESFTIYTNLSIPYTLKITQISGPSIVEESSDRLISFNDGCKGGTYVFLASLFIKVFERFVSFHQRMEATLFTPPTYIRFSQIIGYPNERIRCLIDGYPMDMINTFFKISDSSGEYIDSTRGRVLRIPSDTLLNTTYTITCQYTMVVDNVTYYDSLADFITIIPRPNPFILTNYYRHLRFLLIFFLLIYLFIEFFLTVFLLCNIRIICYGLNHDYVFKTFVMCNRFRKNVRYDEKMTHISAIILDIQKRTKPGEKLKLETFFKYLRKKYRDSYTPGFATVPPDYKPPEAKRSLTMKENEPEKRDDTTYSKPTPVNVPLTRFYGLGTSPTNVDTRVNI